MNAMKIGMVVVAAAVLVSAGSTLWSGAQEGPPPALPAQPNLSQVSLVVAQPFELLEQTTHWYRSERPQYTQGTLLVLAVDTAIVHPRQTFEPVLYVGAETAERVNTGHESGYLVAIVPGTPDLTREPIFFGDPALPEAIDQAEAQRQLDLALANGIQPSTAEAVAQATRAAEVMPDGYELRYFASYLVEEFSSIEVDLITGLRAPLLR